MGSNLVSKPKPLDVQAFVDRHEPLQLFQEFTFVDNEWARAIEKRCVSCNYIPRIEYHGGFQSLLFHSLFYLGQKWEKGVAKDFIKKRKAIASCERELEQHLETDLRVAGIFCRSQVACAAGVADLVTADCIIELKFNPSTNEEWLKAIGQAVAYRHCLGKKRAVVFSHRHLPHWFSAAAGSVGVAAFSSSTKSEFIEFLKESAE